MSVPTEQVTVTVAAANGVSFTDTEGNRWTISKFARPTPAMPPVGSTVVVTTPADGKRFVSAIQNAPTSTRMPVEAPSAREESADTTPPPAGPSRDLQIARMNALTHAVAICTANRVGAGEKVKLVEVLACAEEIERWVLR